LNLPFVFLRNKKWFTFINLGLLAAGVLLWIQSNVFAWKFGVLDGSDIEWSKFRFNMLLEVFCYVTVIVCIIRCRRWFSNYTIRLASIVIATQIIAMLFSSYNVIENAVLCRTYSDNKISWKNSEWTLNGLFDYSDDTDVHLLILDEFGASIFDKLLEDEPLVSETFHDFTYFNNCLCDVPATAYCIPQITTSCEVPDEVKNPAANKQSSISASDKKTGTRKILGMNEIADNAYSEFLNDAYARPFTLFDMLSRNGYTCSVCTADPTSIAWNPNHLSNIRRAKMFNEQSFLDNLMSMSQLIELTLFRSVPTFFKSYCYNNFGTIRNKLSSYNPNASDRVFIPAYQVYEDEEVYEKIKSTPRAFTPNQKQFKYFHLSGCHPHFRLNKFAKVEKSTRADTVMCQGIGVTRIVHDYLAKLKETNSYDNSLIIVMSDHGFRGFPETSFDNANAYRALLLVKRPSHHSDVLQVNSSPLQIKDTTPAILTELGIECPEGSFSWYDVPREVEESRKNHNVHRSKSDVTAQKFVNKTMAAGEQVEIQFQYVTLQSNEVKVEILGDEYDEIGKLDNTKLLLGLSPPIQYNTIQYITPLKVAYKLRKVGGRQPLKDFTDAVKSTFNKTRCWVAKAMLDLSDIPDGEYELFVVLPDSNKHAKLGRTIRVINGIPVSVNKLTTENIAVKDGRTIQ
jgi:hypothetical protein